MMTVMRTIIELPEGDLEQLDSLARHGKHSRAEVIRRAVVFYLNEHPSRKSAVDLAFGILKGRIGEGLAFEDKMRGEWERGN